MPKASPSTPTAPSDNLNSNFELKDKRFARDEQESETKKKTDNSLPALETSPATVDGKVQDIIEGGNPMSGNSSLSESSDCKDNSFVSDKQGSGLK